MGFSVHWRLYLPADFAFHQVRAKLEELRVYCTGLPFDRVSPEVRCLQGEPLERERRAGPTRWVWGDLSLPRGEESPREFDLVEAAEIVSFVVWPGRGTESGWFGMGRHPGGNARTLAQTRGMWLGTGSSKTLYAAHPGAGHLEQFMRCHVGLIAALDEAKRRGIDVEVSDDGAYWETREVSSLIEKLSRAEHEVARIVGSLTDQLAATQEGMVLAPMRDRSDFERIEGTARTTRIPIWSGVVRDLLERTGAH